MRPHRWRGLYGWVWRWGPWQVQREQGAWPAWWAVHCGPLRVRWERDAGWWALEWRWRC